MTSVYRSLVIFLALLLIGGLTNAGTAVAISPVPSSPALSTLSEHLRSELRSMDATRQERALIDVVALSQCTASCTIKMSSLPMRKIRIDNDTGAGSVANLTILTPVLTRIYRVGPTDELRLLALSALLNIGDETSLDAVVEHVASVSPRVKTVTHRGLSTFFLTKYPELNMRISRNGTLALDDIHVARARAERQMRKQARRG